MTFIDPDLNNLAVDITAILLHYYLFSQAKAREFFTFHENQAPALSLWDCH